MVLLSRKVDQDRDIHGRPLRNERPPMVAAHLSNEGHTPRARAARRSAVKYRRYARLA